MAEQEIHLRHATLDDVIGIVYVEATTTISAYQNAEYQISEDDTRSIDFHAKVPQWQHALQSPNYQIWVQVRGEEVLGFLAARKDGDSQEIHAQYVLPDFQNQGLGSQLIEVANVWFDSNYPVRLRIISYLAKAADFYKKHQFHVDPTASIEFFRFPSGKSAAMVEMTTGEIDTTNVLDLEKATPEVPPAVSQQTSTPQKTSTIEKVVEKLIGRADLARISGVRPSTIKHYTEIGILPFEQKEARLARRYNQKVALARLQEIQSLKEQGLNMSEITERLSDKA